MTRLQLSSASTTVVLNESDGKKFKSIMKERLVLVEDHGAQQRIEIDGKNSSSS